MIIKMKSYIMVEVCRSTTQEVIEPKGFFQRGKHICFTILIKAKRP